MMPSPKKALADIAACGRAEMGGHQCRCRDCDPRFWVHHGCRYRACRACHGPQNRDWQHPRQAELLPCNYYHLVATVLEEMRPLFLSHQELAYTLFLKTVAGAVLEPTRDRKCFGAAPGILMVLRS